MKPHPETEPDHDTPPRCAWCDAALTYRLTDDGASMELAHHAESAPRTGALHPEEAYALARLCDALPAHPEARAIRALADAAIERDRAARDAQPG